MPLDSDVIARNCMSVIHSDRYSNVPHFAGKFAVERMIEQFGLDATILRVAL